MSALRKLLAYIRGANGELLSITPPGGFVSVACPAGTTVLDVPARGSLASTVVLTNSSSAVSVVNLSSTDLLPGVRKTLRTAITGTSVAITSVAGAQIYNGTTAVTSITVLAAATGTAVTLQYNGNGVWKLLDVAYGSLAAGTATIA